MTQLYQYFLQIKNTELFYHDFSKHNKILKFNETEYPGSGEKITMAQRSWS